MDTITVLRPWHASQAARKKIDFTQRDGDKPKVHEYDNIKHWRHDTFRVESLRDVAKIIYWCAKAENGACIVRGNVLPGAGEKIRRLKNWGKKDGEGGPYPPTLDRDAREKQWICLDVDGDFVSGDLSTDKGCLEAALRLRALLPESLRHAQAVINLSNRSRNEVVKGHIWLWLPYKVHESSLRSWQRSFGVFDPSLFEVVQPHYVSPPEIIGDPWEGWRVAKRIHCLQGDEITPQMMPTLWMSGEAWIAHKDRKRLEAQRRKMESQKVRLRDRHPSDEVKRKRSEALVRLYCQDIHDAGVGARHDTILRKIHKAQCKIDQGELEPEYMADIVSAAKSVLPGKRHKEVDRMLTEPPNFSWREEFAPHTVEVVLPQGEERKPAKKEVIQEDESSSRDISYIEPAPEPTHEAPQSSVQGDLFGGKQRESHDLPIGFSFEMQMLKKTYKFGDSPPFHEAAQEIMGLYNAARSQYGDPEKAKEKVKPFLLQAGWRVQDLGTLKQIAERMRSE